MRPLEIVLLVLLALASLRVLVPWLHRSHALGVLLAWAAAVVAVGHGLVDGVRWQLAPAYLLTIVLLVGSLRRPADRAGGFARMCATCGLVLTLVAAVLAWGLPVVTVDEPSGDRAVATVSFRLVDPSRDEIYTDEPSDAREVVVQAWYPTRSQGETPPFVDRPWAFASAAGPWLQLPPFTLSHIGLIRTNAIERGDPATTGGEGYPVVVYSHGWGGFRTAQVDLMEELASQGFVVFAIDHTYASLATSFPDGPVVPIEPDALPDGVPADEYQAASTTLERVFAADISFLLDRLVDVENADRFDGLLDLSRVGLLGHSTGGGAAIIACAADDRCDAVAGLDPWVEPVPDEILTEGVAVPMLSIVSGEWDGNPNDALIGRLHASSSGSTDRLVVEGTAHRDVTVLPLLTPLASQVGLSGITDPWRTHTITEAYVLDFFDATLRDGDRGLLDTEPSPYAEVRRVTP